MQEGCRFRITRGIREGQPCGRPINRKQADLCMCLQHIRSVEAQQTYQKYQQRQDYYQINKPVEIPNRTILPPQEEPDEVLAEKVNEVISATPMEEEHDLSDEALIELLNSVRRTVKKEATIKTCKN